MSIPPDDDVPMDAVIQAILDQLSGHAAQERAVITGAPFAFVFCLTLVAVAIWFVLKWHFQHEIDTRDSRLQIHEDRHKAKDEQLAQFVSKAISATPEELVKQVAELARQLAETEAKVKNQQRRRLSPAQRETLLAACYEMQKNDSEPLFFGIYCNSWNGEAEDYARQLGDVFSLVGMTGGIGPTSDVPRDLEGIVIRVKDENAPSINAKKLSDLLRKASIAHRYGTIVGYRSAHIKADQVELAIGRDSA